MLISLIVAKGEKGFKSFLRKRNRKNPNASGDASNDSPQLPSPNVGMIVLVILCSSILHKFALKINSIWG